VQRKLIQQKLGQRKLMRQKLVNQKLMHQELMHQKLDQQNLVQKEARKFQPKQHSPWRQRVCKQFAGVQSRAKLWRPSPGKCWPRTRSSPIDRPLPATSAYLNYRMPRT
jgi:hypothetical protein